MGRFINADVFASTGQGLLGNNMFAYCNNNPINMADYQGYLTISIGIGGGANLFVGASEGISIAFDDAGNIEIQRSYSTPRKRETTSIGLFNFGVSKFIQITNKSDVSELTAVSTYLGFSDPAPVGFDVVVDAPVADNNGKLIGVQFSKGTGAGVDVHVSQTYTETLYRFTWKDVINWGRQLFGS